MNTASTAVQLRFDILKSSLPDWAKSKLQSYQDSRITPNGQIIIKAQNHRSQKRNKQAALDRLAELIRDAIYEAPTRIATKPTRAAKRKRVENKVKRGKTKRLRKSPSSDSE